MSGVVALDTETTGLHAGRQAWDIAMIRRNASGDTTWQFFVDVDLADAEPIGLRVGRFYERHPYGRYLAGGYPHPFAREAFVKNSRVGSLLDPQEAARHVARVTHGAHILGAVPNFDAEVLAALLRRHGLTPGWHYHLIDVEAAAVGYLHGAGKAADLSLPWKSDDLSRGCGVEPPAEEERHTALADAQWALRWWTAITGGAVPDGT